MSGEKNVGIKVEKGLGASEAAAELKKRDDIIRDISDDPNSKLFLDPNQPFLPLFALFSVVVELFTSFFPSSFTVTLYLDSFSRTLYRTKSQPLFRFEASFVQ